MARTLFIPFQRGSRGAALADSHCGCVACELRMVFLSTLPMLNSSNMSTNDDIRRNSHNDGVTRPPPLWIGSVKVDPPILAAPMAGFTNYAFRQIVRRFGGAGLLATEMVSAKGMIHIDREEHESHPRLWGVQDEPRPLAVQMWDNDPGILAEVGGKLAHEYRVSIVDINFGCPVKQVTEKAHSGSYLLSQPQRMGTIIERVVQACAPTPVTAKIRLGCTRDTVNAVEVAQVVESAGAAALTVHGRTAEDYFRGTADWDRIATIKGYLKKIPLIGNGDLDTPAKIVHALTHYGVDGVMIARAALGKPWLFRQAAAALAGEPVEPDLTLAEQRQLLLDHWQLVVERFGPAKGAIVMRKFACCYAQGKPNVRQFRSKISTVETPEQFEQVVWDYFPRDAG